MKIEESNPKFESCAACIYSDDNEYVCILRGCIHAVSRLKECYVPKLPTIERTGKWEITDALPRAVWEDGSLPRNFCPNCGCRMTEDESR